MRLMWSSEDLRDARCLERVGRVGSGLFGAQARAWEDLIGIGNILRIECAANKLHGCQVGLGEHVAERLLLLLAHAVLASDGAAMVDAEAEDTIGEFERFLLLAGHGLIVKHQWMQVAVAGMEDVGYTQASRAGQAVDLIQQVRKRGARNDAVLHYV